jgi:hypothetical protein
MKTQGMAQGQQETARVAREAQKAIDAQVKGFATSGKSMQAVEKEIGRLEETLQGLAVRQAAINREMEKVGDTGTKEYKALSRELKQVRQEAGQVTGAISSLDRAFLKAKASRQGFAQGLMQGFAPGVAGYLQRGPGMRQQMMGAAIGGFARRGLGAVGGGLRAAGTSLTGGMFAGAQGVAQGLGAMPLVGGILGPAASRALAQAQQRMQAQQVELQTMPFVGGIGLRGEAARAGARARGTISDQEIAGRVAQAGTLGRLLPSEENFARARKEIQAQRGARREQLRPFMAGKMGGPVFGMREAGERLAGGQEDEGAIELRAMDLAGKEAEERVQRGLQRERASRGQRARRRVMGRLELGMGTQFGMDINAERQFRAQVQQVGGGYGDTAQEVSMSRTAMAAQTAFGIGGDISGAFLQAGRRGGLVGAEGGASRMLTDSLADAMKMGLEGSEVTDYLQQMAAGISSWKTTGIPFNKQSMADIAGTLGTMGMGGVRGMAVAGGVSRAAEQLSRTGPQSVGQLMMLQTLGGMTPGKSGMEAMEEALIKLEEKQFKGEDFKLLMERLTTAGGGGAEGRRVAYGVLSNMGINITRGELKRLDEGVPIQTWEQERERRMQGEKLAGKVARDPQALIKAAADAVPNALKEQARLTNRQIANGAKLIDSMSQLEAVAQKMTELMTELLAPVFKKLGVVTEDLSGNIAGMQAQAKNWVESIETGP